MKIIKRHRDFSSTDSACSFFNKMGKKPYVTRVQFVKIPNGLRVYYWQDRKMRDDYFLINFQR